MQYAICNMQYKIPQYHNITISQYQVTYFKPSLNKLSNIISYSNYSAIINPIFTNILGESFELEICLIYIPIYSGMAFVSFSSINHARQVGLCLLNTTFFKGWKLLMTSVQPMSELLMTSVQPMSELHDN